MIGDEFGIPRRRPASADFTDVRTATTAAEADPPISPPPASSRPSTAPRTGAIDLGSGKKQSVDLWRKVRLRRDLLDRYPTPGPAFVPFLGTGDIAQELYGDRPIWGIELDPNIAAIAQARLPEATVVVGNAERDVVWPSSMTFALADFDAYSNPYRSLDLFWHGASIGDRVVIFGTDGMRQGLAQHRGRSIYGPLPEGKMIRGDLPGMRRQLGGWWARIVRPYLVDLFAPAVIVAESKYLRAGMMYFGWAPRSGQVGQRPGCDLLARTQGRVDLGEGH